MPMLFHPVPSWVLSVAMFAVLGGGCDAAPKIPADAGLRRDVRATTDRGTLALDVDENDASVNELDADTVPDVPAHLEAAVAADAHPDGGSGRRTIASPFVSGSATGVIGTEIEGTFIPDGLTLDGRPCTVTTVGAETRCVHAVLDTQLSYATADCSTPLLLWSGCEVPDRAFFKSGTTLYRVTGATHTGPVFTNVSGCQSGTRAATGTYYVLQALTRAPSTGPTYVSRTVTYGRLRATFWDGSDGSSALANELYDITFDAPCNLERRGNFAYCVPPHAVQRGDIFSDATCGTPAGLTFGEASGSGLTLYYVEGMNACASTGVVLRKRAAELVGASNYYARNPLNGACDAFALTPGYSRLFATSEPVDAARLSIQLDPISARISARYAELAAGVRAVVQNIGFDDTRFGTCSIGYFDDGVTRCSPDVGVGFNVPADNRYTNDTCTGDSIIPVNDACSTGYAIARRSPNAAGCPAIFGLFRTRMSFEQTWRRGPETSCFPNSAVPFQAATGGDLRSELIVMRLGVYL